MFTPSQPPLTPTQGKWGLGMLAVLADVCCYHSPSVLQPLSDWPASRSQASSMPRQCECLREECGGVVCIGAASTHSRSLGHLTLPPETGVRRESGVFISSQHLSRTWKSYHKSQLLFCFYSYHSALSTQKVPKYNPCSTLYRGPLCPPPSQEPGAPLTLEAYALGKHDGHSLSWILQAGMREKRTDQEVLWGSLKE